MYTPNEKELLEMGFRKPYDRSTEYHLYLKSDNFGPGHILIYNPSTKDLDWALNINDEDNWRDSGIYPRSREHLEQIILAFQPE